MGISDTFKEKSFSERVGSFGGYVMGRAFKDPEAAIECMQSLGKGMRAAFEAFMPAAIGLGVKHGKSENRIPLQMDARDLVEQKKEKSSLQMAFSRGVQAGKKANLKVAERAPPKNKLVFAP